MAFRDSGRRRLIAPFFLEARRRGWLLIVVSAFLCTGFGEAYGVETPVSAELSEDQLASRLDGINAHLRQVWSDYGLKPSARATDGEWCRRLYLDVLGRIPSTQELEEFLSARGRDRREQLVERLLFSPDYVEDYVRNWTTIWTNLLIGRTGGSENNSLTSREGMQAYVSSCVRENRPYDQFVYGLITATGSTTPDSPEFNGATNFLAMKLADKAVQATARTAQLFLGMQVQCTQCHNHPFNEWKQNQFWELNAFFRQARTLRRFEPGTNDLRLVEVIDQDFAGEGHSPEEAEIYYEMRSGILKTAYPVFVDGMPLAERSGYLSAVNRRVALGRMIVESDCLERALVNRLWAHFLGYGFTQPVDDMGPHNPPTHPELLDYLAQQFRACDFDLKQLIHWITLSEAYQLSSRGSAHNDTDDPLRGEPPKFSRFYLRQMRPEELYQSLLVATQADKAGGNEGARESARQQWLRQFTRAFGTDEGGETTTFDGTIPQTLMMFNGDLMRAATRIDRGTFLGQVAASQLRPADKIKQLYLAAYARPPTGREMRLAQQLVVARAIDGSDRSRGQSGADRRPSESMLPPATAALQDIWWALLNSNEFILNH